MKRLFFIIYVLLTQQSSAQDDIMLLLDPGLPPARIGVEAGPAFNSSRGSFQSACDPRFSNGAAVKFVAGATGELFLTKRLTLQARISVDNKGFVAEQTAVRSGYVFDGATGDSVYVRNISFNQKVTASFTALSFSPSIRFRLFENLFLSAGPSLSYIVTHSIVHEEEIITLTANDDSGRSHPITYSDGSVIQTSEPQKISGLNKIQLGVVGGVAYEIPVSALSFVTPSVYYIFPLTTVTDIDATKWKLTGIQATLGVKFRL